MIEPVELINEADRRVGSRKLPAGEARSITIARHYDTTIEDLWDACTNPDRIRRWFLPVSGQLGVGGRYQLKGNAGGTIESCDPPHGFSATWEYGANVSWIEVRLSAEGDGGARFELEHISAVDDGGHWAQYGPGATGVGWDLALLALARDLVSDHSFDLRQAADWTASDEGRRFLTLSSQRWRDAGIASGEDPADAEAAAQRTTAFYMPPPS
jgi:uncharacterized protein YndB with AHSA1/START domain